MYPSGFLSDPRHIRIDRVLVSQHKFSQNIPEVRGVLGKKRCFRRCLRLRFRAFRRSHGSCGPVCFSAFRSLLCTRRGGLSRFRIRKHPKQRRIVHIAADRRVFLRRHIRKFFNDLLFSAAVFAFPAALLRLLRFFRFS